MFRISFISVQDHVFFHLVYLLNFGWSKGILWNIVFKSMHGWLIWFFIEIFKFSASWFQYVEASPLVIKVRLFVREVLLREATHWWWWWGRWWAHRHWLRVKMIKGFWLWQSPMTVSFIHPTPMKIPSKWLKVSLIHVFKLQLTRPDRVRACAWATADRGCTWDRAITVALFFAWLRGRRWDRGWCWSYFISLIREIIRHLARLACIMMRCG